MTSKPLSLLLKSKSVGGGMGIGPRIASIVYCVSSTVCVCVCVCVCCNISSEFTVSVTVSEIMNEALRRSYAIRQNTLELPRAAPAPPASPVVFNLQFL